MTMDTFTCRHCGGLLLSEKLDSCGCSAAAKEQAEARRSAAACSPSSLTPETDAMASMRRATSEWITLAQKLERERNAMREWIMQAAPMLSVASCIVIDEAVERLGEIEGCRAVLELCPLDFIHPTAP